MCLVLHARLSPEVREKLPLQLQDGQSLADALFSPDTLKKLLPAILACVVCTLFTPTP